MKYDKVCKHSQPYKKHYFLTARNFVFKFNLILTLLSVT